MKLLNNLYGLVSYFANPVSSMIIVLTMILVGLVVYKKLPKLLLSMILVMVICSVIFYSSKAKEVYSKDNIIVFKDGSYLNLIETKKGRLEYVKYSKRGVIVEKGLYRNERYIPFEKYGNVRYNYFLDFFILSILLSILYVFLFFGNDLVKLRDLKRKKSLIPFTYKNKEQKSLILGEKYFCTNCDSKNELMLIEEIYKKGMHVLHLECSNCKNSIVERIDL